MTFTETRKKSTSKYDISDLGIHRFKIHIPHCCLLAQTIPPMTGWGPKNLANERPGSGEFKRYNLDKEEQTERLSYSSLN